MATVPNLVIAIGLILVFVIGLNLGLHGAIVSHGGSSPVSTSEKTIISSTEEQSTGNRETIQVTDLKTSPPKPPTAISQSSAVTTTSVKTNMSPSQSVSSLKDREINNPLENKKGLSAILAEVESTAGSRISSQRLTKTALDAYKTAPVILLTCNRAALLKQTLDSLLTVRGVTKDNVLVVQDGNMLEVSDVVRQKGLQLVQNLEGLRLRGGAGSDGASRIARHYKFALSAGFDHFPEANAIVIVEDDLLFSPDFYDYLTSVAPVLDADETTFVVSAWNDNGFKEKVRDPMALRRTEFFPGLGWILPRRLYKQELEPRWPKEHWDHWLRSVEVHRGRESVYPQMPRTYHNGIKGTFMDESTHNRYFRDIHNNRDSQITWSSAAEHLTGAIADAYEHRLQELINKHCHHVRNLEELFDGEKERILCVWIEVSTFAEYNPPFENVGRFFGIWHEHKRGNHRGLHEFYFESNYVLLLNVHADIANSAYRPLRPSDARVFVSQDFRRDVQAVARGRELKGKLFASSVPGQNCNHVCSQNQRRCRADKLKDANHCSILQQYFSCDQCVGSIGSDQPAFVSPQASSLSGHCLYNEDIARAMPTCEASHRDTQRLCVCE